MATEYHHNALVVGTRFGGLYSLYLDKPLGLDVKGIELAPDVGGHGIRIATPELEATRRATCIATLGTQRCCRIRHGRTTIFGSQSSKHIFKKLPASTSYIR